MGGGPPDLVFPEEWAGVWAVESTLTNVLLPLGPDFVPDPKVTLSPARLYCVKAVCCLRPALMLATLILLSWGHTLQDSGNLLPVQCLLLATLVGFFVDHPRHHMRQLRSSIPARTATLHAHALFA